MSVATSNSTAAKVYSARPVSVLIDARKIKHGGIGIYCENLINALIGKGHKVGLLGNGQQIAEYSWQKSVAIIEDDTKGYSWRELFTLAKKINRSGYDVFSTPHYVLPFGLNLPTVVTVHDLIHIKYPEAWYYPHIAKFLIRSSVSRANLVLTVSQASYNELSLLCGNSAQVRNKLFVVPNSLNQDLLQAIPSEKYKGIGTYLLAVISQNKAHKGLSDLVQAYANLLQVAPDLSCMQLVIVGQGIDNWLLDKKSEKIRQRLPSLHALGAVTREELAGLYKYAQALVVPSLAEGFCIPALEAHAFGKPVLSRPVAALVELLGPDDRVSADFSLESLQVMLGEFIVHNLARPQEISSEFRLQQSQRFSVDNVAQELSRLYQKMLL